MAIEGISLLSISRLSIMPASIFPSLTTPCDEPFPAFSVLVLCVCDGTTWIIRQGIDEVYHHCSHQDLNRRPWIAVENFSGGRRRGGVYLRDATSLLLQCRATVTAPSGAGILLRRAYSQVLFDLPRLFRDLYPCTKGSCVTLGCSTALPMIPTGLPQFVQLWHFKLECINDRGAH